MIGATIGNLAAEKGREHGGVRGGARSAVPMPPLAKQRRKLDGHEVVRTCPPPPQPRPLHVPAAISAVALKPWDTVNCGGQKRQVGERGGAREVASSWHGPLLPSAGLMMEKKQQARGLTCMLL
jgi:hypothetical protein